MQEFGVKIPVDFKSTAEDVLEIAGEDVPASMSKEEALEAVQEAMRDFNEWREEKKACDECPIFPR